MQNNGWIKLHRKITEWEWYDDINTFRVFIHLLLISNHKPNKWHGYNIEIGQCIIGTRKLAKTLRISRQSLRTSLERLKSTHEITQQPTHLFSIITIVKYKDYQYKENKLTHQSTHKLTNDQPTPNPPLTTLKEYKNVKNEKNNNSEQSSPNEFPLKESLKWQLEALEAIKILNATKKSSIFKCFKNNRHKATFAINDCKELGKLNELYFFKVYSELTKKT